MSLPAVKIDGCFFRIKEKVFKKIKMTEEKIETLNNFPLGHNGIVCIIGVGLIGGSMALALKEKGIAK